MSDTKSTKGRRALSIAELRRSYPEVDERERLSFVARHFCNGTTPSQIKELLEEEFGGKVRREEPYRLLQVAAAEGYFHYYPPLEVTLGERLTTVQGVEAAHVVATGESSDVTARGAEVLLGLIREKWESDKLIRAQTGVPDAKEVETVRIGLAGGNTVRGIVRALVELLKRENPATIPQELWFHTACTGMHYKDSSTDPNAFVTHLLRVPGIETKIFAVPYNAPPVTTQKLRDELKEVPLIAEAARLFREVDILVTSGSSWRTQDVDVNGNTRPALQIETEEVDGDGAFRGQKPSQLKALMKEFDPAGYQRLTAEGVVADMLWQPLSFSGPVDANTKVEAMTLAKLSDLPGFINDGMKVLLALGPYHDGGVRFHKGDVLTAALGAREEVSGPLFTHLVCDHRTAGAAARAEGLGGAGVESQD